MISSIKKLIKRVVSKSIRKLTTDLNFGEFFKLPREALRNLNRSFDPRSLYTEESLLGQRGTGFSGPNSLLTRSK